jgi:adenylate kinase
MGQGAFAGIPLQLAGTRKILEFMDWGDYGAKGTFINIGAVGVLPTCTILQIAIASNETKHHN